MPKAHLKTDTNLYNEFIVAKELHMTHRQLMRNLAPGEVAYWCAVFELDNEHFSEARAKAEREANAKHDQERMAPGKWLPRPNY